MSNLASFIKQKSQSSIYENFTIPPVCINEIFENMIKLDVNKSAGCDNIGPKILKLSAPYIVSSLTYIFNRMIDTGIFPTLLKNAKVSPVFKAGEKDKPTNYRPISVLPTLSQLIERHVSNYLYKYLSNFKLLHSSQSVFRPNHSCQTALMNIIDK